MDAWLRTAEAAAMLRVSPARVRELVRDGHLVYGVHVSKPAGLGLRFRRSALDAYLAGERPPVAMLPTRGRAGCKVNLAAVGG